MAIFTKHANPFAGASQQPIDLLQSVSAMQLAACVPFIKITKIDNNGKPSTDVRPLMFDLTSSPQFSSNSSDLGLDSDTFIERSLVSLNSLNVEFTPQYGQDFFRDVTLDFTVHHPSIVFDRNSKIAWREILEAGKNFSLEYGWSADPTVVPNELFNGHGTVTDSGLIIKSTQTVLLNIFTYSCDVQNDGQVKVTVKARENGDIALRETKFSDAFEAAFGTGSTLASGQGWGPRGNFPAPAQDDAYNVSHLKTLIDGLPKYTQKGRGKYFLMLDIMDNIIAPMITRAAEIWGYSGYGPGTSHFVKFLGKITVPASPVVLLLGDFNVSAGPQSEKFFGQPMDGHGIEDFVVPVNVLIDKLSKHSSRGRSLYLRDFIMMMINLMNGTDGPWASPPPGKSYRQPKIQLRSATVKNPDGSYSLVLTIYDVMTGTDPFHGADRIPIDKQSRAEIMRRLQSLDVPVLSFATAGSLISAASFQLQPDAGLQGIQVDEAYKDRKDRVQQTQLPNSEGRKGQSRNGELIMPISILAGEITMVGNFVFEVFALIWIDFFNSSELSGVYHVNGVTDTIEPGKFTTKFKVISESIDPLNTRRKVTDQEFADAAAIKAATTKKSIPKK